jgi:hypothetical protein
MGLRDLVALTLIVGALGAPEPGRLEADDAVARMRAYAAEWRRALLAMVAEEAYTQTATFIPYRSRVDQEQETVRRLVSDVLFVQSPAASAWLMFRDVIAADGEAITDRQSRFDALFVKPDHDVIASARRIADESARFNVGGAVRNINTPVAALIFLEEYYASSTRWKAAPAASGSPGNVVVSFEQRRGPFAIKTPDGKGRPATGKIWIEGSGRIVATELLAVESSLARSVLAARVRQARSKITATFGPVPGMEFWAPLRMEEEIAINDGFRETIVGHAVYTKHRLFQTSVRIIGQP